MGWEGGAGWNLWRGRKVSSQSEAKGSHRAAIGKAGGTGPGGQSRGQTQATHTTACLLLCPPELWFLHP